MQLTQSQETERVSQQIILRDKDVELSEDKDHPDEDIGHESCCETVATHSDSTVPEQRRDRPCIRACDSRQMHEGRESRVSPVGNRLVQEVRDQNDLRTPEMVANPEQNPGKDEQVVENEVSSDIGGCSHQSRLLGEEMPDIAQLGQQKQDP